MKFKLHTLDPELKRYGFLLKPVSQITSPRTFTLFQRGYRALFHAATPQDPSIFFKKQYIKRSDGGELCLYLYGPKELDLSQPVTGLLWLHGGGYATGGPQQTLPTIEAFIRTSPSVVVVPEYRLSIEAPFPAAFEDAYMALLWMNRQAKQLGIREDQLFIGGESAGGGLACCVSAYARDTGTVAIACQFPLYPMLDDRMTTPSMIDNDGPAWNITSNRTAWKLYLGRLFGTEQVPVYAAPARLKNYQHLPPTYTYVGRTEPFYDETKQYIDGLTRAGVPAQMDVYEGVFHGFDLVAPKTAIAKQARKNLMTAYKQAANTLYAPQR